MEDRDAWTYVLASCAVGGALLGTLYFGSLWWTVRRGLESTHSAWWFFGSLLGRLSVAMAGFYLASRYGVGALLACLMGFVAGRMAVIGRTRRSLVTLKAGHAP